MQKMGTAHNTRQPLRPSLRLRLRYGARSCALSPGIRCFALIARLARMRAEFGIFKGTHRAVRRTNLRFAQTSAVRARYAKAGQMQ